MKYLSNYSEYILEKRDHTNKIKKFANNIKIINWANDMDSDMSLWLANQLVIKLKDDAKKRGYSDEVISGYLKGENKELDKVTDNVMNILNQYFIKVLDYVNSPLHDNKPNVNRLSLNDALEKSNQWHKEIEQNQGKQIEDEDGELIMEFPDGFYWIDLETSRSEQEGESMGHCGNTNQGTTLLSLRRDRYPYVTVAYDENDKIITQIKGRGNKKPVERYHKYVVDLIIELEAEKFKSEYDRSTDLLPEDLSQELYNKLEEANPDYIENSKAPSIEEMREMYYDDIKYDIQEYAYMYPSVFFDNLDDDRFIEDVIKNEKENFELENMHYVDILKYVKSIIPEDEYEEYLTNKIDNDDNLDDEEKEEAKSIIDIDDVSEGDLIEMIEDLNYRDEVIEEYIENRYHNYTAKDYIEEVYGRATELEKSTYDWLYQYLNDSEFAREIADNEDESYLEDRYQ
jgi:hypothetical protein